MDDTTLHSLAGAAPATGSQRSLSSASSPAAVAGSYPPSKAPSEVQAPSAPLPDRGKAAYLFLAAAFTIETVIWGLPASYGILLDYYDGHGVGGSGTGSSLLPLVGTVSSGFMYVLGPPVSLLLNPRPRWRVNVVRLGCCLCPLSLLLSSFAKAPWQLLLTQGLLYSIGGAMAYYSTFFYLQDWFHERRGFANGVCFAGTAAGGLVLPFVLNALLRGYGAAVTLQALAVATFLLLGAAVPVIRPRLPIPPSTETRRDRPEPVAGAASEPEVPRGAAGAAVTSKQLVKSVRLWAFLAANVLQGFGYFVTLLYLPAFATSLGLSSANGSAVLACVNGACVISRVAMGIMSDKKSPHQLGFFAMATSAVAVSVLWGVASTTLAPLIVFAVVMGLCSGGWTSLYSAMIKSLKADDPSLAAHLFSTFSFTRGLGALLCAPIASALISRPFSAASPRTAYGAANGEYGGIVLFAGLALAAGAGLEGVEWLLAL